MRIGQVELDDKELLIIGGGLALAALFGPAIAREISKRAAQPLKGLTMDDLMQKPIVQPMKTISPEWELDDEQL